VVHTVSGATITNGGVLLNGAKIERVLEGTEFTGVGANKTLDLQGQHIYPGLIALNTGLGLTEIEAVRATRDDREVGDYTPDVESWIAVNPDSELLPVARANGIAYFEPVPDGAVISGQSGLLAMDGWTTEQMAAKKPVALHVFGPRRDPDLPPPRGGRRGRGGETEGGPKPLDEQAKERRTKVQSTEDFFEEARHYAKTLDAAAKGGEPVPEKIP